MDLRETRIVQADKRQLAIKDGSCDEGQQIERFFSERAARPRSSLAKTVTSFVYSIWPGGKEHLEASAGGIRAGKRSPRQRA